MLLFRDLAIGERASRMPTIAARHGGWLCAASMAVFLDNGKIGVSAVTRGAPHSLDPRGVGIANSGGSGRRRWWCAGLPRSYAGARPVACHDPHRPRVRLAQPPSAWPVGCLSTCRNARRETRPLGKRRHLPYPISGCARSGWRNAIAQAYGHRRGRRRRARRRILRFRLDLDRQSQRQEHTLGGRSREC